MVRLLLFFSHFEVYSLNPPNAENFRIANNVYFSLFPLLYKASGLVRRLIIDVYYSVLLIYCGGSFSRITFLELYAESYGYHYYLSGGNRDPLENYRGEECIILDDLRGSSFPMSELLNLLDCNTFSPVS